MVKRAADPTAKDFDNLARGAWSREVRASLESGQPVTFAENGRIVRVRSDGRREIVRPIAARTKDNNRRNRASA